MLPQTNFENLRAVLATDIIVLFARGAAAPCFPALVFLSGNAMTPANFPIQEVFTRLKLHFFS